MTLQSQLWANTKNTLQSGVRLVKDV